MTGSAQTAPGPVVSRTGLKLVVDPQATKGRASRFCQCRLTAPRTQRRLTGMADTAQVATAASSKDPSVGLKAVRSLRTLVERLEALQVDNARDQGWTWEQIAQQL